MARHGKSRPNDSLAGVYERGMQAMLVALIAISPWAGENLLAAEQVDAHYAGYVRNRDITEASGMAVSHYEPDLLWIINDDHLEGYELGFPLFAVRYDGANAGAVQLSGVDDLDGEDLASFQLDGRSYLLIGDIGDNRSRRESRILYVAEEPKILDRRFDEGASVEVAWTIEYRYEDGPRDSEALAVDVVGERVFLLTKRTRPPVLYQLPLRPGVSDAVARRVLALPLEPAARANPTAMDISPDGLSAVVATYRHAYLYRRESHEDWAVAFSRPPLRMEFPRMRQAESISFSGDGRSVFITSERIYAPLVRLQLPAR